MFNSAHKNNFSLVAWRHDAGDLRGNVVVGEIEACERAQCGDLIREGLDLVVSEF